MYINFNKLMDDGNDPRSIYLLCMIAFSSTKKNDPDRYWSRYIDDNLVDVKEDLTGKWGQNKDGRYTLTKDGKNFLKKYTTISKTDATEGDEAIVSYLNGIVEDSDEGFFIGNKTQLLRNIVSFRTNADLTEKEVFNYVVRFFADDKPKYLKKLENLFFKPPTVYSTKFTLTDSMLYDFIVNSEGVHV